MSMSTLDKDTGVSKTRSEGKDDTTTLLQAKDRAQVAANTAMSIVHVALLRTIINAGPSANKYYYALLVLIIMCLVLQVLAGLLALALSHMKNYFQKHKEDACYAIFGSCCSIDRRDQHTAEDRHTNNTIEFHNSAFGTDIHITADVDNKSKDSSHDTWQCPIHESYRIDSFHLVSNEFKTAKLMSDLLVVEADVELKYMMSSSSGKSEGDDSASVDGIMVLNANNSNISEYNHKKQHNIILNQQYNILRKHYEETKRTEILKRLAFWQQMMNYILYFVFTFNIFITAFVT